MNGPSPTGGRHARAYLVLGAASAAAAVALGAFAAHALKSRLTADEIAVFETGVRYQMYHAFGLLAIGLLCLLGRTEWERGLQWAGRCFAAGTILFSGSLYALIGSGDHWFGLVTPFGGLFFIAGWCVLAATLVRRQQTRGDN